MNKLISFTLALGVLASPALAFAQSTQAAQADTAPVTRAQVRAELARLEQAGYNVASGEDANYPANIQQAEAKVAATADTQEEKATSAVGGVAPGGSSEAGAPVRMPAQCVGPVGFCDPFFGS